MKKYISILILALAIVGGVLMMHNAEIPVSGAITVKSYDYLMLVNKSNPLKKEYKPVNLVKPHVEFISNADDEEKMMEDEAAKALEDLFNYAKKENVKLYGVSGYRSFKTQKQIYNQRVKSEGKAKADEYVAHPGKSEHQTGLALDVTNEDGAQSKLYVDFGATKEGKWLKDNAYKYGFIMRYPLGKEDKTGYNYESWHIRYVGKEDAKNIYDKNITLEEYLESK